MRYSVDKIPHELKVPFNMRKCPSAKIILSRPSPDGVSDDELLKNYAYAINGQGKEKNSTLKDMGAMEYSTMAAVHDAP